MSLAESAGRKSAHCEMGSAQSLVIQDKGFTGLWQPATGNRQLVLLVSGVGIEVHVEGIAGKADWHGIIR
jgi:hypothetical protein